MRLKLVGRAGVSTAAGILVRRGLSVHRLSDPLRDRSRERSRAVDAVIDRMRLLEEAGHLRAEGDRVLRIEAPEKVRWARLAAAGRSLAGPDAEHPTEQEAVDVPADRALRNVRDVRDLRGLDRVLERALTRPAGVRRHGEHDAPPQTATSCPVVPLTAAECARARGLASTRNLRP